MTTIELPAVRGSDGRLSSPIRVGAFLVDENGPDYLKSRYIDIDIYSRPTITLDPPPINKAWQLVVRQGDDEHERTVLFGGDRATWDQLVDVDPSTLQEIPTPEALREWEAFLKTLATTKGDKGDRGEPGQQGDPGAVGAQGDPGPVGEPGRAGDPGPQGIQGVKGDKGDRGDVGPIGAQGIQGTPGVKGDTGATGAQGIQGVKGDTGAQGLQGVTGAQGLQGVKGDPGATGATGTTGPTGAAGADGLAGDIPATDYGHKAWTCDVAIATSSQALASGVLSMTRFRVQGAGTPTSISYRVATPATGTSLFRVAIYDTAGVLIAYSTNNTANIQAAANQQSENVTASRALVKGEPLYLAVLWVGTGTAPALTATPSAPAMNDFAPGSSPRATSYATTGLTDLPASATPNGTRQTQIRHLAVR